jgi:protein-tyrosine-phosphatase/DNA-binding transcriptional ArsR family regulator
MEPAQPPELLKLLAHDIRWGLLKALTLSDCRVHELVEITGQPMNLVSYHLKKLRDDDVVTTRRSDADGRDVYYSVDVARLRTLFRAAGGALHPLLGGDSAVSEPIEGRVLFVCTHNSARSQMAEGLLRAHSGGRIEVYSAGSEPTDVHPLAVEQMAARGIDISRQHAKSIDAFTGQVFDYVVTVCDLAREVCPTFPGESIHWSLPDPAVIEDAEARRHAFAWTARQLEGRITALLTVMQR